jgi:phosphatidylinositol glycan class T
LTLFVAYEGICRVSFEQQFLKTSDYPRDPFKGVSVPHGYVSLLDAEQRPLQRWPTPIVSIAVAVPDMSMPFNVIMITCTLLSIGVSTFLVLGAGQLEPVTAVKKRPGSWFQKLRTKLSL